MSKYAETWEFLRNRTAATVLEVAEEAQRAYVGASVILRQHLADSGLLVSQSEVQIGLGIVLVTALILLLNAARFFKNRHSSVRHESLHEVTRHARRLGIAATVVFVVVLGGWSSLAPLASASLAVGVISPDGYRKTIQHLEGGIIRSINVREGDVVKVGDPLIILDNTKASALKAELHDRLVYLLATETRLEAERTNVPTVDFSDILVSYKPQEVAQVTTNQLQLFLSRRAAYQGKVQILDARIRQLDERNSGLQEMLAAEQDQLDLIDEEIDAAQILLKAGLESKPRVLALRRLRADIISLRAANRAKIAENGQAIGETRLQLIAIGEERQEKIGAELAQVRGTIAELRGQLPSREDVLARTVIRAPVEGTVMNLRVNTESGVVSPGQSLLDIVPDAGGLIIDARVKPTDIERIQPGMKARVILTAYRQRTLPLIFGRLRSISADAIVDEKSGSSYFLAKVEVSPEDLKDLENVKLVPGMPAEIMLIDGEQTLLSYLIEPIQASFRRSMN
jgi:HlyD family type I secretion membrane fusion protein